MTLSEHEQRTLDGIETGFCEDDPGFVVRLDLTAVLQHRRRVVVIAQTVIWIGWLVLVIGAGMAHGPVSIGALVGCYGLVMIIAGSLAWIRNRSPGGRTTSEP
jgi:hypothetical protein